MVAWLETFNKKGSNTGTISANYDFPSAVRIRMTENQANLYGEFNYIRVVNKSSYDIFICTSLDKDRSEGYYVSANSIFTLEAEDGKFTRGIDIYNADGTNDITANNIHYYIASKKRVD